jgi:hypothetical protein
VARDWWWPWWVSSLIDVAIFALALAVFLRARRTLVRQVAVVIGVAALVAAGLAPVVMKDEAASPNRMNPEPMMTQP